MHAPRYYTRRAAAEYRALQEEKDVREQMRVQMAMLAACEQAALKSNEEFVRSYISHLTERSMHAAEFAGSIAAFAAAECAGESALYAALQNAELSRLADPDDTTKH